MTTAGIPHGTEDSPPHHGPSAVLDNRDNAPALQARPTLGDKPLQC